MNIKELLLKNNQAVLLLAIGLGLILISTAVYFAFNSNPSGENHKGPKDPDILDDIENNGDPNLTPDNNGAPTDSDPGDNSQPQTGDGKDPNGNNGQNSKDPDKSGDVGNKGDSHETPGNNGTPTDSDPPDNSRPPKGDDTGFVWPKPTKRATSKVSMVNNVPRLFINNTQIPPLMFFGNTDMSARYDIIAEEVKKAAKGNIHFHSVISSPEIGSKQPDEVKYFKLENDLDVIIDNDPDSFILLRVNVGKYYNTSAYPPGDIVKYVTNRTEALDMVSISSKKWLADANKMLKEMVEYIRSHPVYSKHVIGYHLECGEWFQYMFRENGSDISESNSRAFRDWLKNKYGTEKALRTAWSDSSITFAAAKVPEDLPGNLSGQPEDRTLMLKDTDRRHIDYLDYIGDLVSDTIAELSKTVKIASNRENIVTAFYGYLFELADPQSGHFKLEKLLANKDIDGFASPESYNDRNTGELFPKQPAGSTGAFMSPVDSIQRAGKMWFVESDQRTFINRPGAATEHDSYLVPSQSIFEIQEIAKRDVGSIMLRGASIWFMDLWSVGWLDDQAIWDNNGKLAQLYHSYAQSQKSMSSLDIAFVVDEASQSLVAQPTDSAWHFMNYQRYDMYRAGISFGMYSMKDLLNNNIKDAKVIFVLNPFRLSSSQVNKIIAAAKGKTIVFGYGFGETSASDITRLTGMNIAQINGKASALLTALGGARDFGLTSTSFGANVNADPRWHVTGGSDINIAKYNDGKIGFAAKDLGTHKAVFFGGMRMNTEVLRAIIKYGKGHIYADSDDVAMANENLYILHSSKKGIKTITFPTKTDVYDYFKDEWFTNVSSIKINMEYGETRYLFYGKKSEIEAMKLPKW